MLKALALGLQFAAALASLAFSIGIIVTGMLNRRLSKKTQPKPELQEPARLIPNQQQPPRKTDVVSPSPQPLASRPAQSQNTPAKILNTSDHQIYMTNGSSLMVVHPKADRLLKQLDKILYVGAHRHGAPFTMPVELDTSALASHNTFDDLPPLQDEEFLEVNPSPLPPTDNQLWRLAIGHQPQRLRSAS